MQQQPDISSYDTLVRLLTEKFCEFPQVEAIALAGSLTSGSKDKYSDIDLYLYTREVIPFPWRKALIEGLGTTKADFDLQYWDLGDEWYHADTGIEIDLIYWQVPWVEEQIERILTRHQASLGYSTCFWHTILNSRPLFDRQGWFQALQNTCHQPYPDELRQAIILKNHAVLRNIIPSYRHQIQKAVRRDDLVSINHRVAALLASYFDVLFALNYQPNPGEKRLLEKTRQLCKFLPEKMEEDVKEVLIRAAQVDELLLSRIDNLIDGLEKVMIEAGFSVC